MMYSKDLLVLSRVLDGTTALNALVDTVLLDIVIVVEGISDVGFVGSVGSNFPVTKCSDMVIKCTY